MLYYRIIMNGDLPVRDYWSYCKYCGDYIHESYPREEDKETGEWICTDCAFKEGLWTEQEYIQNACFWNSFIKRAAVHNGEIWLTDKKLFPWEKPKKRQRHDPSYISWRTKVFERDKYTCAICGQVGGELNAHHIRPFAEYPDLRLDLDNGVTLCKACHKRVHKEKDSEWLHPIEQGDSEQRHMEQASDVCEGMDVSADKR